MATASRTPHEARHCTVVLPSLMPNGGVREALRLANDLGELLQQQHNVAVVTLWQAPPAAQMLHDMAPRTQVHALSQWPPKIRNAPWQWPVLAWRFWKRVRQKRVAYGQAAEPSTGSGVQIFTHYTTLPLAFMVPPERRWFLVQDLEWLFIPSAIVQAIAKWLMLKTWKSGRIVTANAYLADALRAHGLAVEVTLPMWADERFGNNALPSQRLVDIAMVLRRGAHKQLEDYRHALLALKALEHSGHARLKTAIVSTDAQLLAEFAPLADESHHMPSTGVMRDLYGRTKCFLHLSRHEGFGLPPLEAMGSGCVPICRDSGGARAYMIEELAEFLLPTDCTVQQVIQQVLKLTSDDALIHRLSLAARRIFDQGLPPIALRADALRAMVPRQQPPTE